MQSNQLYCFLDANTFIHFQTFDEVDWPSVLSEPKVCLVLAPCVTSELSKFKDNQSNAKRQKRVRTLLSKLSHLLEGPGTDPVVGVRRGVTLLAIPKEPKVDWLSLGLDPMIADDRLIASIYEFRAHDATRTLLLLTNDFPLRLKAKEQGIPARDPEGAIEQYTFPSEEENERRKLRKELEDFKSRVPKLVFGFLENNETTGLVQRVVGQASDNWITDKQIQYKVDCDRAGFEAIIQKSAGQVREEDIEAFRDKCKYYLEELEEFLVKLRARDWGQRYQFGFRLKNDGSEMATGIEIDITFPDESFVVSVSDVEGYNGFRSMELPSKPEPKWLQSLIPLGYTRMHDFSMVPSILPSNLMRQPVPRGPLYDVENRAHVTYEHPKLRPKEDWRMESVVAFISPYVEGGFIVEYTIRADGLPAPVNSQLNVHLQGEEALSK